MFEVDCGTGEFLLPLHQNGYIVGGTDADPDAIAQAISAMPDGMFQVSMASALDPGVPWDVVVCRSFAGSRELAEMRGLLARMFAKATHAIAVLNVPEERRTWMLHALAEIGANAIQMEQRPEAAEGRSESMGETFSVFARV